MHKKIFSIAVLLLGCAVCALAVVKVDNSSPNALVKSMLWAVAEQDRDALWELLPPKKRAAMIAALGDMEKAKKFFGDAQINSISKDDLVFFKSVVKDKRQFDAVIKAWEKQYKRCMVNENGKWFIDFAQVAAAETAATDISKLKAPAAIDHSTPEKLTETFLLGILFERYDLVWQAMAPESVIDVKAKSGSLEAARKSLFKAVAGRLTKQQREQTKAIFAGQHKQQFVNNALLIYTRRQVLLNKNGKWYLDFKKLK